ncbi:MAG: dTDP-4-dehydrorhamnose reductase [Verrucomicrobiales bacterium]
MNAPHIAITGANGRLGQSAIAYFEKLEWNVTKLDRSNFDLSARGTLKTTLSEIKPDILLNTAGMTDVDGCERDHALAARINADAPSEMAEACAQLGTKFVHISTDYVFEGEDSKLLDESDPADPISVYGSSKKEGEDRVLKANPAALVLRISWLFGPGKPAFPEWIIGQAENNQTVSAVADKWSSPTSAEDLCEWIAALLDVPEAQGIFHLANSGTCSWQEFGSKALEIAAKCGVELKTHSVASISMNDLANFVARRPKYTSFTTKKFSSLTGLEPSAWEDALERHLSKTLQA